MHFLEQKLDELLRNLSPLDVDWRDDIARRVIERIRQFPIKITYDEIDIANLLSAATAEQFNEGLIICRLFLGLSKDKFEVVLKETLGIHPEDKKSGYGINRYKANKTNYVKGLINLGLLDAIVKYTSREPKWSDILEERLRSGRGSAISGQKRGRGLEDFVEDIIKKVFDRSYDSRCKFIGKRGQSAKCDFAIPDRTAPCILIESKAYGATGSKMTDIIGDIDAIITAKRPDVALLLFTDGLTWRARQSDLRQIVERQNNGELSRIYTMNSKDQFEADLNILKQEYHL